MASLSAAIFNPIDDRDAGHWTLHLIGEDVNEQYGIIDNGSHYSIDVHQGDPSKSGKFAYAILIGDISHDKLEEVRRHLKDESTVDNTSTHWNCQNWVIERANHLNSEGEIENAAPDFEQELQQANADDQGNQREFELRDEQAKKG